MKGRRQRKGWGLKKKGIRGASRVDTLDYSWNPRSGGKVCLPSGRGGNKIPPNNSKKGTSLLQSKQQRRCTDLHKFGALNAESETSLRWGGVSSLEAHVWRFPSTKGELLLKRPKGKKSLSPPATTLTYPPVNTHDTSYRSASLSGLSGHLCGRHRGVRGGEDAATLMGTLSPFRAVVVV